ncbi:alpha/beta fold hydrolase [Nonomuraea wenchangensis]|uniref:alpha/beta fold hydrolase n=1 Tax=Nonomuraea wenchangensis TaxID=568860 RepID=UPI003423E948
MTEFLDIEGRRIAYYIAGEGPLIVLSHGIGDRRQAFRLLVPELARAGFRVAAADMRGHGESSAGDWKSISRTDVAGDLVALIRHLGGHHRRRDGIRPRQRHRRGRPVHPPADLKPGRLWSSIARPPWAPPSPPRQRRPGHQPGGGCCHRSCTCCTAAGTGH